MYYVKDFASDYVKYAASNDLILLYPQVKGCFDMWGYTDDKYAGIYGVHPRVIMTMVDRLMSK